MTLDKLTVSSITLFSHAFSDNAAVRSDHRCTCSLTVALSPVSSFIDAIELLLSTESVS